MSITLEATTNQTTTINALREVLKVFREHTYTGVDEAMMDMFLLIAAHNDKTQGELVELGGRPQSSTNRYITKLSNAHALSMMDRRTAPGLVVTYPDPMDKTGKRKRVRLTPRGEKLLAVIHEVMATCRAGRGT